MNSPTTAHLFSLISLNVPEFMRSRPIGLGLGALGILGFQVIYKLSKRSNVFITLSGPESDSFLWGESELGLCIEESTKY
jgi:hypothetical protein